MRTIATYNIKTNLEEVLFKKLSVLQEINSAMEDLDDFLYGDNCLTSEELSYEGSKFQLTFDGIYGPFRDSPDEYIRLYVILINEEEELSTYPKDLITIIEKKIQIMIEKLSEGLMKYPIPECSNLRYLDNTWYVPFGNEESGVEYILLQNSTLVDEYDLLFR